MGNVDVFSVKRDEEGRHDLGGALEGLGRL